jgi:hypothetical protein
MYERKYESTKVQYCTVRVLESTKVFYFRKYEGTFVLYSRATVQCPSVRSFVPSYESTFVLTKVLSYFRTRTCTRTTYQIRNLDTGSASQ